MGFSPTFGARRFPKGEWKELWCARRRKPPAAAGGIDAPTPARTVGLPPYGFSPASVPEGFQRASGKPFGAPAGAYLLPPPGGIDAPTPARTVGLPPRGGQYFLSKRKKVPKKASGTATPEAAHVAMRRGLRSAGALRAVLDLGSLRSPAGKKPLIAHFDGGARYVARSMIGQISPAIRRAPNSPFSAVKMGGPFSLRCLSPLCSAAVDVGQTPMAVFGMLRRGLDGFAAQKAARVSKLYWPFARAARPSVERRSVSASWQEIKPDPRAARPVAERR